MLMGRMINSGVDVLRKSVMNLGDQHVQARGWHAQEASHETLSSGGRRIRCH